MRSILIARANAVCVEEAWVPYTARHPMITKARIVVNMRYLHNGNGNCTVYKGGWHAVKVPVRGLSLL
jgi:hypothetical protein